MSALKSSLIKRSMIFIPLLLLVFIVIPLIGGAPLDVLFGVPSPTAGVTRALLAAVRFDFATSLSYHPLAIPLFFVFIFSVYHDLLPIKKIISEVIFIVTGISVFIFYLFRLFL